MVPFQRTIDRKLRKNTFVDLWLFLLNRIFRYIRRDCDLYKKYFILTWKKNRSICFLNKKIWNIINYISLHTKRIGMHFIATKFSFWRTSYCCKLIFLSIWTRIIQHTGSWIYLTEISMDWLMRILIVENFQGCTVRLEFNTIAVITRNKIWNQNVWHRNVQDDV